jgi:hypothetical protein
MPASRAAAGGCHRTVAPGLAGATVRWHYGVRERHSRIQEVRGVGARARRGAAPGPQAGGQPGIYTPALRMALTNSLVELSSSFTAAS